MLLFVLISHPLLGQYDTLFFEQMDSLDDNQQKNLALQLTHEALLQYENQEEWQKYVKCYERMARYLQYEGKNEERRRYIELAILKGKDLLGEEHFIVGEAVKQRGDLLFETGKRDSAFIYLQQSIDLFDKIGDAENLCWSLITEAVWRFYTREYDRMAPPLQRALSITEIHPEFDRNIPNLIFQTLAIAYRQTGAYDKSLEAAQKAVAFSLSNPDFSHQDSIELADRYNNLGIMYADRKDFQQAIQNYRIALNLRTSFKAGPSILIQTYNNLGTNLQRFGKLQEAADLFEKSRSVLATHPEACNYKDSVSTFIFLADNALEQGKPLECIAILQGILPLTTRHQFQENELHFNLGKAHSVLGNYAEAVAHFRQSGPLFQARGQANLVNYARNQRRLGNAYLQLGQLEQALTTVQEALQLLAPDFKPTTHFDNPNLDQYSVDAEVLPLLQVKGKALQLLYTEAPEELKQIGPTYLLADATIDRIRQEQLSQESKLALSTYAQAVYNDAIQLTYLLHAAGQQVDYLVSAFHYMEKSKALTLLEGIRESRAQESTIQAFSTADSTFRSLFREEQQLKIDRVFYERKLAEARQQQDTLKQASIETTL
ncbi:MAG: tetratricopeptide repeat protein, partial [Phaeodactylibacter sp.]|nr:tetratricopeptide repeat protein [Phaeodactylibacter sp.]